MDTFNLKANPDNNRKLKNVVIDTDTYNKLVALKSASNTSIVRLIAQMVDFCSERLNMEK